MAMHINLPTGEFTLPEDITPEIRIESPYAHIRGVQNLVIDLGGVMINLRRERAVEALRSLGVEEADKMLGLYRQEPPFLSLETGEADAATFFDILRGLCAAKTPGITDRQLTEAFNRFLVDLPVKRLRRLRELRERGYRLYMLSNTNPVMYHSWIENAFRAEGLTVNDYFDGIMVSFQELICKPDIEIFSRIMRRYRLDPRRTVMLDDSEANCDSARQAGMLAVRIGLTPQDDFLAVTAPLLERTQA